MSLTEDNGLSQLQREPTREGNILDLYFNNNPGLMQGMHTIPGISDHDIVVVDSVIKPVTQLKKHARLISFLKLTGRRQKWHYPICPRIRKRLLKSYCTR